jgi:preprotein translocase subunit YajC
MIVNNVYGETDSVVSIKNTSDVVTTPSVMDLGWINIVPMVLIFIVFYFLVMRPQEKRRQAQQQLIAGVKKGESIVTNCGTFGSVSDVHNRDGTIQLEIAKGVKIKILKTSIADIVSRKGKQIGSVVVNQKGKDSFLSKRNLKIK